MTTATKRPKPHQRQAKVKVVQPPAKFAHLKGDALRDALVADQEIWTAERFAAEAGRAKRTIDTWLGNRTKYDAGERAMDDYTAPRPTYVSDVPIWKAGDCRAWMMRTGKMRRDGTFVPHKPAGRPRGVAEANPRPARGSEMDVIAPQVLAAYRELLAGDPANGVEPMRPADARAALAERYKITGRKVIRRLQRGRDLEAGRRPEPRRRRTTTATQLDLPTRVAARFDELAADSDATTDTVFAQVADELRISPAEAADAYRAARDRHMPTAS